MHTKAPLTILNTLDGLAALYPNGKFSLDRWTAYIERIIPNSAAAFFDDIRQYDFSVDCLPHIQYVHAAPDAVGEAVRAFECVTRGLDEKLLGLFEKSVDVEIILYLGLCNGAGWVTQFNGQDKILLGVEKILELKWYDIPSMKGLVYHELGHVFQAQYGVLERQFSDPGDALLWQLFTEGVAMVFEQKLVGDDEFFHQDKDGWKAFMAKNLAQLKVDFTELLHHPGSKKQQLFGDWTNYHTHGDAGYYLGTQFVRALLTRYEFEELLSFDIEQVKAGYTGFLAV